MLHITHNRWTALLSPTAEVGWLRYFKIRKKNNNLSTVFMYLFVYLQVSTKIFCGTPSNWGMKNSQEYSRKSGWKEDRNHITPEVELSEKYLGLWSYLMLQPLTMTTQLLLYLCYLYHLILLIFQNVTFYQRLSLSCEPTEWADGLQTVGTFCLVYDMKNRQKPKVPDSSKRVKRATTWGGAVPNF